MVPASSNDDDTAPDDTVVSDSSPSNYAELGDGQVMDILKRHIDSGSVTDRLVLFKGAIEHSSRLCRAMVMIAPLAASKAPLAAALKPSHALLAVTHITSGMHTNCIDRAIKLSTSTYVRTQCIT